MCEECESDQALAQTYAQKRARIRAYWTPKRKPASFRATETTSTSAPTGADQPKI